MMAQKKNYYDTPPDHPGWEFPERYKDEKDDNEVIAKCIERQHRIYPNTPVPAKLWKLRSPMNKEARAFLYGPSLQKQLRM